VATDKLVKDHLFTDNTISVWTRTSLSQTVTTEAQMAQYRQQ